MAAFSIALPANAGVRPIKNERAFSVFAHGVINKLREGDYAAISRAASAHGVIVVRRQLDWQQSKAPRKTAVQNTGGVHLSLPDLPSLVWTECEIRFEHSALNEPGFRFVEKQFQALIRNTEDGYPRSIVASLNARDIWGSRYLGPVIQGKIASNTFWYLYFVREKGQWKIWRFEFVTH